MKARVSLIGAATLVVAVGVSAAAFTASNTLPTATNAGQGVSTTSGFTVTDVEYATDVAEGAATPVSVQATAVIFKIQRDTSSTVMATANAKVFVQLRGSSNADWASCVLSGSTAPVTSTCTLTGAERKNLSDITGLSVVAFDDL